MSDDLKKGMNGMSDEDFVETCPNITAGREVTPEQIAANENWTIEEIDEIREGLWIMADDLNLDNNWVEMMVGRVMDTRDRPEIFMTLEEMEEMLEGKGIDPHSPSNAEWEEFTEE